MTNLEFSNEFDVLYNNITSNQAPGLDEYEKSVFLTKAQDEIVKAYFNPRTNKTQEGFDGNARRQIDFSMIMRSRVYKKVTTLINPDYFVSTESGTDTPVSSLTPIKGTLTRHPKAYSIYDPQASLVLRPGVSTDLKIEFIPEIDIIDKGLKYDAIADSLDKLVNSIDRNHYQISYDRAIVGEEELQTVVSNPFVTSFFDLRDNTRAVTLDPDVLMFVNEYVEVTRGETTVRLTVLPINYIEYSRLMSKPYKRPLKNQAWRLLDHSDNTKKAELVVGPVDTIKKYVTRYVKRPRAIILSPLSDGTSLDGYVGADRSGNPTTDLSRATQGITCELDPILHPEILQRAVELAKAAYTGDLQSQIALGQTSQTNMGMVASK